MILVINTLLKDRGGNINMIKLLLMYQHFMPNVIIDKFVINCCKITRNIKLSSFIPNMMRKNMFIELPMKYCYTSVNTQ
jgi:hypothetical protein